MKVTEKRYSTICKCLAVIYFFAGAIFFLFPHELASGINFALALVPALARLPQMAGPDEKFWLTLTFSMMMMLVFICLQNANRPRDYAWAHIHLLSKGLSTLGFIFSLVFLEHYGAYLVGAITDGALFVFVAYLYYKLKSSDHGHGHGHGHGHSHA